MPLVNETNLVNDLNKVYYEEEWWHTKKISEDQASDYHRFMLRNGRIIYCSDEKGLAGYMETWRVNFEQLGRLICHTEFFPMEEDIESGNICYLNNIWIREDQRHTKIMRLLKVMCMEQNKECEYFIGQALRKKCQPVKVFSRKELVNGGQNGW
jgi:hypothetical protein